MSLRVSAGLIMYRFRGGELEVFLAHPGGPHSEVRDDGYWTIPKGRAKRYETLLDAARREFEEEAGVKPHGPYLEVGSIRQRSGKIVHAWAFQGDWEESRPLGRGTFEMPWPPLSGQMQAFPEVDRAGFFTLEAARRKLTESQWPLLHRLQAMLGLRKAREAASTAELAPRPQAGSPSMI